MQVSNSDKYYGIPIISVHKQVFSSGLPKNKLYETRSTYTLSIQQKVSGSGNTGVQMIDVELVMAA